MALLRTLLLSLWDVQADQELHYLHISQGIFSCHTNILFLFPQDLRKKAARLVSAKCALASRVDACHESQSGSVGEAMRTDIEGKLDKLQEPPPVKQVKALPAPIEQQRKKRGGRR